MVTKRNINQLKRSIRRMPGVTSARNFEEAGLPDVAKTTRNHLLGKMAVIKSPDKRPPLTSRHKRLYLDWAKTYVKNDMKFVLITDASRATLDGPDGWAKGWVYNGEQAPMRLRHQQGGGGVMIWLVLLEISSLVVFECLKE